MELIVYENELKRRGRLKTGSVRIARTLDSEDEGDAVSLYYD